MSSSAPTSKIPDEFELIRHRLAVDAVFFVVCRAGMEESDRISHCAFTFEEEVKMGVFLYIHPGKELFLQELEVGVISHF